MSEDRMRRESRVSERRRFLENVGSGVLGLGLARAALGVGTAQAATSLADAASLSLDNAYAGEQVFDGDVLFASGKPWYDAQAFGAAGNGVVDDTAAIQSLINLVGTAAGVPAISIFLPAGTYKLTATIVIQQRAVTLRGAGVGNPSVYTTPGRGTTIKWEGPVGVPMFKVVDASHCTFEDLLILGDDATPPSEGIYFEQPVSGGQIGTNEHHLVRRCRFGHWTWTSDPVNDGAMAYGIRFGGVNANNDQFSIEDCQFYDCTIAGVAIDSIQSIWGHFINPQFNRCNIGIRTATSTNIWNLACNRSATADLVLQSTAHVQVHGYYSEHAALLFHVQNAGSCLILDGGHVQFQDEMIGSYWGIHAGASAGGGLVLRNLRINNKFEQKPKLSVQGTASSVFGYLIVEDCTYQGLAGSPNPDYPLDDLTNYIVQAGSGSGGLVVFIRTGNLLLRTRLSASAVLSTTPPAFRLDGGLDVRGLGGLGFIELTEQSPAPTPPPANGARLFLRDNGAGQSELCVMLNGGVHVLAS